MHFRFPIGAPLFALWTVACGGGDDTDSASGAAGSSSGAGTATDGPSTGGTRAEDSGPGPGSDATGSGTAGSGSGGLTGSESGSGGSSTGSTPFDCEALAAGPFTPERIFEDVALNGAEDLGFDGQGHLAARGNSIYLLLDAEGGAESLAVRDNPSYGLRFRKNGDLLAALYAAGTILRIGPDGLDSPFAINVGSVNGLYPDFDDGVWYTNMQEVHRISPTGEDVAVVTGTDASGANGVVFDQDRGQLFYTNYSAGRVQRVPFGDDGEPESPRAVATIPGAALDGLTLDTCGNLYVVDNGGNRLFRIFLDEAGAAIGSPELLADFPTSVANAQFGSGPGWESDTLYVIGVGGGLYRVPVAVPGAPYVTVR